MVDKRQTKVKVLMSYLFIDDMFTTLKMARKDKSIAGAIEVGVRGTERKPQYRRICVFGGLAWMVENDAVIDVFLLTRKRMWPETQLAY